MPFSNMFDPAGVIHEELESLQIDAIVVVAHLEVFFYIIFFFIGACRNWNIIRIIDYCNIMD
jgi:hypothetical protein